MTEDAPTQAEAYADFTTAAAAEAERRLPRRQAPLEADIVVVKFSGDGLVLELDGDDVDLGTDLKIRHEHRLIAEFRRDAVDGWWYKSAVSRDLHPGAERRPGSRPDAT